ncbi:MAG: hypothetical protein H7Y20_18545 [Bryobacteraceae bacterium]|nr:hypothetical protein [Bryobacteraceae bacterium]
MIRALLLLMAQVASAADSKSQGDVFHGSAPKESKPGKQQSGQQSGGSLEVGIRTGGAPKKSTATKRQPEVEIPRTLVLGPVLQAAVNKGDCRVFHFRIDCPGFLADVDKDRLDRDPRHDGTFEDSPIKLYGGVTAGNKANEQPERFSASATVCDARDLAAQIFLNYDTGHPIRIVKLRNPDRKDTYLILLSGTEIGNLEQATGVITDARLGTGLSIRYSEELMEAAKGFIPKGSRVILAGHSLGGMVAEKIASDRKWQGMFRTTDVITYGSPQVSGADVVGTRYTRFWDTGDPIPQLSLEAVNRKGNYKLVKGPTGEQLRDNNAHDWYPHNPELTTYDALGQLGNACLTLDAAQTWRFRVAMDGKLR